jgi:hypothetical protein
MFRCRLLLIQHMNVLLFEALFVLVFFLIMCVQRRQAVYVKRNIETRSRNLCCRGKTIRVTYSECECAALVNQHAKRMRRIVLSSVGCLAPRRLIKQPNFREKVIKFKKHVKYLTFSVTFSATFFVTFVILRFFCAFFLGCKANARV